MKLGVFGPHYYKQGAYDNYDYVAAVLDAMFERFDIEEIHSGGGQGVEQMALRYATLANLGAAVTPPNIKRDGTTMAFTIRNQEIVLKVDHVVLFWDGADRKYFDLIKYCATNRTPVTIYGLE